MLFQHCMAPLVQVSQNCHLALLPLQVSTMHPSPCSPLLLHWFLLSICFNIQTTFIYLSHLAPNCILPCPGCLVHFCFLLLSFIEYSIAPEWSRSNHMSQNKLDFPPKWDNQVANQPSQMDHPMDFPEQIQVVLGQTQLSLGAHIKKYLLGLTLMRNH